MTVPVKNPTHGELMEAVIVKGDLAKLEPGDRANYYMKVCQSIGLNPLTRPLEYIVLNGKMTLYAKRDCADQLRKINGISVQIVSQDQADGLLTVHVRAKDGSGREDEDLGVVAFPDTLKGEARANAILKAVTKAKRRVTLSISGLGFLDETEIEDIPASAKRPAPPAPNVMMPPHDAESGELFDESVSGDADAAPAAPPESNPQAGAASISSEAKADRMIEQMKKFESFDALSSWAQQNRPAYEALDKQDRARIDAEYRTLKNAFAS